MSQLSLPFSHVPRFGSDDFLPSPSNAEALAAVEAWPRWVDRVLLLLGPPGAGKSHLASIWAAMSGATRLMPHDFAGDPHMLVGRAALIEDADRVVLPEAGLFHLLNVIRDGGGSLLVTAREPPAAWSLATPDLVSRLRLAPSVLLEAPDAALLRAVLVKLFADRQIAVEAPVVDYLARRLDRSLAAAREAVEALDRAALDGRRRITRALAAELLGDGRLDDG